MTDQTTTQHLVISAPGSVSLLPQQLRPLGDGDLLLETLYSGISAGTELTFFAGTNPKVNEAWDDDLKLFIPSTSANDTADTYPHDSGYMEVARVIESKSQRIPAGSLISMPYGHYSRIVVNEADRGLVVLPQGFEPILGIFVSKMGPICANGILYAADELHRTAVTALKGSLAGERVLVFGAGIVGLLVASMARWAGAREVLIVDGIAERLSVASRLDLEPMPASDLLPRIIKKRWQSANSLDTGADIVFQCTGSDSLLAQGLSCLREQGAVIDLGFYQQGATNVFLGKEFHHNRLRHICAQIGAPPRHQQPLWDRQRLAQQTIAFLDEHGPTIKRHVISQVVPFSQAQTVYERLLKRDPMLLQVVLQPDLEVSAAADTIANVTSHSPETDS